MKKNLSDQKSELLNKFKCQNKSDIDVDGDEFDKIQGNIIVEMTSKLNSRDLEKINKIDGALLRIKEKSYGLCEDCKEAIPEKRLLANPYFLTCVSCAEDRELQEKRKNF